MTDERLRSDPTMFNVGDLVQHRASGERAVVTDVYRYCTKHANSLLCMAASLKMAECETVPSGTYRVSFGFLRNEDVDGSLIELVADAHVTEPSQ